MKNTKLLMLFIFSAAILPVFAFAVDSPLKIENTARNISDNVSSWGKVVVADPGEVMAFQIKVTNGGITSLSSVNVRDVLPAKILFKGNVKLNGTAVAVNDISNGINIGNLNAGETKTITFEAQAADASQWAVGQTKLANNAAAMSGSYNISDGVTICINKAPTYTSTGITDDLLNSSIIPLLFSIFSIVMLKAKIFSFEKWMDVKKAEVSGYRTNKELVAKARSIKEKEF